MQEKQTHTEPVISLQEVSRFYAMGDVRVVALNAVSFDIFPGEFVSIMGPSGSGKSTCMNMIGCLDRPTSGQVFIDGKGTFEMTEKDLSVLRNRTVGFVFQQYHLLATMNVLENVMLPLRYKGIPRSERKTLALEVLEKVGLTDRISHYPCNTVRSNPPRILHGYPEKKMRGWQPYVLI